MPDNIYLPKLNGLSPTVESTVLKIMEEAGELARAVLKFLPYQEQLQSAAFLPLLDEVAGELLDVAQTCVTMIFVIEDCCGIRVAGLMNGHLDKLTAKGYVFDQTQCYQIEDKGNFKYLALPRLRLDDVTLLTTVCKIQEEIGELTQYLGKQTALSGEAVRMPVAQAMLGCAGELLDVAQCCFTMMYILEEQYQVDIRERVRQHVDKLQKKGYCA